MTGTVFSPPGTAAYTEATASVQSAAPAGAFTARAVVLADGEVVEACATHRPDLVWTLRGGVVVDRPHLRRHVAQPQRTHDDHTRVRLAADQKDFAMRTPALITATDDTVSITVQQRSAATPGEAFRTIVPIDLTAVFHRVAPFPGVASVANQTEQWDHVGPTRNPRFDDGSQADEQLTEYVEGSSFAYQLTGFTNILSRLATGVRGEWNFNPDGDGTLIRWTYEFKPLPGRRWILAGPFTPLWRRYMVAALARCVQLVEAAPSRVVQGRGTHLA
ncbi:SRPBCC family protein [Actinoplanes sp. NPDC051494]|uniref:SRPBCC family protein n=1 Tax=Actinoplanes sp. NPDC051494 TaxID=3363907 RepID=UPI0037BBED9B